MLEDLLVDMYRRQIRTDDRLDKQLDLIADWATMSNAMRDVQNIEAEALRAILAAQYDRITRLEHAVGRLMSERQNSGDGREYDETFARPSHLPPFFW